jgi:hypothetical protein
MALTDKLTNIAQAIRDKTGMADLLTLDEMPYAIETISTGETCTHGPLDVASNGTFYAADSGWGGFDVVNVFVPSGGDSDIPESAFVFTGDCDYRFAYDGWVWFLDKYKNQITTHDITSLHNMFRNSQQITNIPFTLNITNCDDLSWTFYNSQYIRVCPKIRGTIKWTTSTTMEDMFGNTNFTDLNELFTPEMLAGFSELVMTSSYSAPKHLDFSGCSAMRTYPEWHKALKLNPACNFFPYYHIYEDTFNACHCLDEVRGLPVWSCNGEQSTSMLDRTFRYTSRVKAITFETNPDGTPIVTKWRAQLLDLSKNVGHATSKYNCTNKGIPEDREVKDDATYAALKNDPDWFATDSAYSRYNHDSAVETINSLPDCSATGTNTIKFLGNSGSKTDGGAINTLTEEEIAVAAAKGWTVTFA